MSAFARAYPDLPAHASVRAYNDAFLSQSTPRPTRNRAPMAMTDDEIAARITRCETMIARSATMTTPTAFTQRWRDEIETLRAEQTRREGI